MTAYVYMWQYEVKKEFIEKFKNNYGPIGKWNEFFNKSDCFLKTELLVDEQNEGKFITIDYWLSKETYLEFITKNKTDYDIIDKQCAEYTQTETKIGEYDLVLK